MIPALVFLALFIGIGLLLNLLSYRVLKVRTLRRQKWDLNICSGFTDGGGVNADIHRYGDPPNFILVEDIHRLPFPDKAFATVLCSHTMEHVDDPVRFFAELLRVGKEVTLVTPPLWDYLAHVNLLEHRWIFLSLRKVHHTLPPFIPIPFARAVQKRLGQKLHA